MSDEAKHAMHELRALFRMERVLCRYLATQTAEAQRVHWPRLELLHDDKEKTLDRMLSLLK